MATANQQKKPGNEVAEKKAAGVPSALMESMQSHAGAGVSTDAADSIVPLIYVLQSLSRVVKKSEADYIPGAEPGMIYLRSAETPLVSGDTGIIFQPCWFEKEWNEWIPRANGGGFVQRYDWAERPPVADAKQVPHPQNPKRMIWVRTTNGNELIETRKHAGFVIPTTPGVAPMPYVIPFVSTGHTVSRDWMGKMKNKTLANGQMAPSFACYWKLVTKEKRKNNDTWFVLDVQAIGDNPAASFPDGPFVPSEEDFLRGLALHNAFKSGAKKSEAGTGDVGGDDDDAAPAADAKM